MTTFGLESWQLSLEVSASQPDNQFNILPDVDGKVFFLRQANNYVSLKLQKGTTAQINITDKDLGSTIMCLNSCEGSVITIIQN